MAYLRVPRDPNAPLPPGNYELVAAVQSGNPAALTRIDLERALQLMYGPQIRVTDYGQRGGQLVIRFTVEGAAVGGGVTVQWVKLAVTGAAILATLWLVWRIATELVELVELISASPGAQITLGSLGIGLALVGGALLVWVLSPRKGKGNGKTASPA